MHDADLLADISHELRNHLFVVGSSVNLLLGQHKAEEGSAAHLLRMQHAIREARGLLDVFLLLAREEETVEASNVEPVLRSIVDSRRTNLERKNLEVAFSIDPNVSTRAPAAVLHAVLGSLIDDVIEETETGKITLVVDPYGVTILNTPAGNTARQRPFKLCGNTGGSTAYDDETRPGSSIANRLCEHFDWRIEVRQSEQNNNMVRLILA